MKKQFLTVILALCVLAGAAIGADDLAQSFARPPDSALGLLVLAEQQYYARGDHG
jgi:hypothetical protein